MGLSLGQQRPMGTVETKGVAATLLQLIDPVHKVSSSTFSTEAGFLDFLVKYPKF